MKALVSDDDPIRCFTMIGPEAGEVVQQRRRLLPGLRVALAQQRQDPLLEQSRLTLSRLLAPHLDRGWTRAAVLGLSAATATALVVGALT